MLREEGLAGALPFLAAEVGCAAPAYATEDVAAPHPLAAIYDDALEDAARDAYQRDYMGYGFSRWRG